MTVARPSVGHTSARQAGEAGSRALLQRLGELVPELLAARKTRARVFGEGASEQRIDASSGGSRVCTSPATSAASSPGKARRALIASYNVHAMENWSLAGEKLLSSTASGAL
jgi:hypothetical protein